MPDSSTSLQIQALLEQSSWVRALARNLARGSEADDLEQQTLLAALSSGPRPGVPLREWLGLVLRNFARQERRSSARREARERVAARHEELPSAREMLERAELQRRIAGAVVELDEPYRTAVLLRYFEGLPPREIARRLGVPVATVRTRLLRAIERLRERFDREHDGDRSAWTSALVPLFAPKFPFAPPAALAALAMNSKILASLVAVLVLGAAGWWFVTRDTSAAGTEPITAAERDVGAAPERAHTLADEKPETLREAVAEAPRPAPKASAPAAEPNSAPKTREVRGRVLDTGGAPLANVPLVAHGGEGAERREMRVTSDAQGRFTVPDAPDMGAVVSGDRAYATVLRASFRAGESREPILILAQRLELAGEVVDESGAPLAEADVTIELPADFRARFKEVLDWSVTGAWNASTDSDGRFEFDDVPEVEGATLHVELATFEPLAMTLPSASDVAMRLVLKRPLATDGTLRGRVVDASGLPIRGAHVALGVDTTVTPEDGTFSFELEDPASMSARFGMPRDALVAVAQGLLPARFEPPATSGKLAWPSFVTLKLEGVPLSIAGRVIDAEHEPMVGVRVYVADATLFGAVGERPALLESLLSGAKPGWSWVETDSDGRFEIGGLLDRDYVVRAHDPSTLLRTDSKPVRAGSGGVTVEMPTDQLYPRVAGRITSYSGTPIAGLEVYPMCDAFQMRARSEIISTYHDAVEGTTTDADGRFELKNVPKSLVYLRINGENTLPLEYGRYVEGDGRFSDTAVRELPRDRIETLEIQVELRCHVQVELADPQAANLLAVLDQEGRELVINLFVGEGRRENRRQEIQNGRSAVLGVPDNGRTLVLYKNGAEVGRVPFTPDPAKLTTVRF